MERQKFEDLFKDSFSDAEATPSDSVWTNIELDLEKASGTQIKKRLLFFQLLAAASMVFAAGIGTIYYMNSADNSFDSFNNNSISLRPEDVTDSNFSSESNTSKPKNELSENTDNLVIDESNNNGSQSLLSNETQNRKLKARKKIATNSGSSNSTSFVSNNNNLIVVATDDETLNRKRVKAASTSQHRLPPLFKFDNPKLNLNKSEPDPGMVMLAKLRDEELMLQRDSKRNDPSDRVWASVGMTAGNYNPNSSSSRPSGMKTLVNSGAKTASSNPSSGNSYSVGASVGGKISKRIVLQGGLSYLTQNSEYTSSTAMGQQVSLNEFTTTNTKTSVTSPYDVNSSLQFLSLPVMAGFIIVDRNLAVQLNGGIATDFFLQGILTSSDNNLNTVTYKPGSDSPYRNVNFSGLVGTELSYKVGKNYRIAVNPGIRYALNSIYKSEVNSQTLPITFDVGVNFRYIFN